MSLRVHSPGSWRSGRRQQPRMGRSPMMSRFARLPPRRVDSGPILAGPASLGDGGQRRRRLGRETRGRRQTNRARRSPQELAARTVRDRHVHSADGGGRRGVRLCRGRGSRIGCRDRRRSCPRVPARHVRQGSPLAVLRPRRRRRGWVRRRRGTRPATGPDPCRRARRRRRDRDCVDLRSRRGQLVAGGAADEAAGHHWEQRFWQCDRALRRRIHGAVGGPGDNAGQGAAWVFTRAPSGWIEQAKLLLSTPGTKFGMSVALSANGQTALVGGGADDAAAFTRSGGRWSEPGRPLTPTASVAGSAFGASVALSSTGATALVGGPANDAGRGRRGCFVAFERSGSSTARP